jgi:lysyl-tRNA synthetase class 1
VTKTKTAAAPQKTHAFAFDPNLVEPAWASSAWPFEEARKLLPRVGVTRPGDKPEAGRTILFETGYGPSGLPHIGTFGEVARTTMVRNAFRLLTADQVPTRLLCFSDDMDGMRKVPENVPNGEVLKAHLHKPLTRVPDPFGEFESFGHHNNAMLRRFLDTFGFEYEFASATEFYTSGRFDDILRRAAERYQAIMDIMLPTLGEERQATYSCFLPISPRSGRVLYVPMKEVNGKDGTITFADEDGAETTLPVTGGNVKLQWKPDFGARWAALGVDFEMYGKDHQSNSGVYDAICRALGAPAPEHYVYELFLDDKGQKISKSKGNGISIDEWLTYASPDSLSLFMFQKPRTAKRLYFDVIPRTVDDYLAFNGKYPAEEPAAKLMNPVWHIHSGRPPKAELPISFALLLNLASASNSEDREVLWGFIRAYAKDATPEKHPVLDQLVGYALNYFRDFVRPAKQYRLPDDKERKALEALDAGLASARPGASGEELQTIVYEVGKANGFADNLRAWFGVLYEVLLGEKQGPRFGSFVELYGVAQTRALIGKGLKGELAGKE